MADTRSSCSRNRRDAAGFSVRSGLEKHQHPQASLTQQQKKPARGRSKSTGTKNEAAFQDLKRWSRPPSSLAALHHLSQCKSLLPFKNLGEEYEALKKNKNELKLDGSYENALLVDSTLLRQRDRINHSEIDIADVVCCFTLPDMHDKIISVVFSTELDGKDPYRHWLQKCNPMRCWTRLLHNVFLKHCKTTPGFEAAFDHIVLCTLLGNYEECDNRPTDIAVRQRMYDIFDYRRRATYNDPEIASFRRKLLKDRECERIWLHATQQYMCWSISTNDELRRYVSNMYPFDKFRQIVTNVNNKMRRIWCEKLLSAEPGDLIKALGAVIKEARLKILDVSYQKPVISFLQYLKELKSVAVPDARIWFERNFASSEYRLEELRKPVYIKPSSLLSKKKKNDSDADDEEEQEVQAESDGEPDVDQEPVFEQMATMQTGHAEQEDKRRPVLITAAQITVAHSEALELLVASLDPTKTSDDDILRQLNAHWTKFGCDPQAGPHLDVLSSEYRISNLPKDVWRKKMIRFAHMHPYAYCLLHEARKLVLRMRGRRITPLPSNIAAKQAQVLADKLKLPPDTVNRESAALWACPCCGEVASLVRSHYSYHKQEYTDGRRGILTSLEGKGQVFCKKDNVVGHRQCGKEPLMEIPLLGYCVTFNKVTHEICCSCGSVMSADPEHTLFNADGAACSQCTRKIMQQQRDAHLALYPELLRPRDFKCMLCDKQLEKGALSHSRYLCKGQKFVCAKKHGGEALVKHLLATLPKDVQEQAFVSDEAAKAVAEAAIKFHKAAKQLKAERDKGKNNRILKQLRANAAAALSRR